MILTQPSPTSADLCFEVAGVPVRVHPFFWVVSFVLSSGGELPQVLAWIVAVFLSILLHEMGHAVMQRRYGGRPRVWLYGFGGLAVGEGVRASPWQQILICLAGPLAGFALAGALAATLWAAGVSLEAHFPYVIPGEVGSPLLREFLFDLFQINILWGLLNLLPIYPLDGGQATRELLTLWMPPAQGIVSSLWVSVITAAAVALYFLQHRGGGASLFPVLMFGMLAFSSWQMLRAYQDSRRGDW